jgi:RimJ/RimL family protein N-acetyltransferase
VAEEILPRLLADYHRYDGRGRWAAVRRTDGAFLGWFALREADGDGPDNLELGYRVRREAWGVGYATEGSRALLALAFTRWGTRRVWAQTMAVNQASRRVMEKVGLRYVRTFHPHFDDPIPGTELGEVEYAVTRAAWLAGHPDLTTPG